MANIDWNWLKKWGFRRERIGAAYRVRCVRCGAYRPEKKAPMVTHRLACGEPEAVPKT